MNQSNVQTLPLLCKRLFPYLKPPLERRAWEWNPITNIDSLVTVSAELPIFLDRLFYMPALWFNTSDWFFFSWNVKYKTVKVFQVCSTSSTASATEIKLGKHKRNVFFLFVCFFPWTSSIFFLPLLCSRKGMPMLCVKTVLLCFVPEQGTQHVGKQWRRA